MFQTLFQKLQIKRPFPFQPYVGKNAFTHKGGMHAAGYLIDPKSFQHIEPTDVGNESSISISELSGKKKRNDKN